MSEEERKTRFLSSKDTITEENDSFYNNGNQIEKEDNQYSDDIYIDRVEFENLIENKVSRFINDGFEKVILLTGAGSSVTGDREKEIGKTMLGLVKDIINALDANSSYFELEEMIALCQHKTEDTKKDKRLDELINLEDLLSDIERFKPFVEDTKKSKYNDTHDKILDVIREKTSYEYDNRYLHHTKVINVLSKRVKTPNKLAIITTNYDTMFEEALAEINYSVIDGFTNSLEPYFNADEFEWSLVKNIPNVTTKELEYKTNTIDLLKIHGSLTWKRNGDRIYRKPKDEINNPLLIFPSSNKFAQSYEEPYFDLFTKFQELLLSNNTLLITSGFSFGDVHIATMIRRAVMRNDGLRMLVSDFNIDQNTEGWKSIDKLRKDRFPVVFLQSSFNQLTQYL